MKLISIEPTPNPNNMKIILDEYLDNDMKFTFIQKDKENYPEYVKKILSIPGVVRIFQVSNFISISRKPGANWEEILSKIEEVLGSELKSSKRVIEEHQTLDEHFGEIQVFVQYFRRLPILVKVSSGKEVIRYAIPKRFENAVRKASKASKNMLLERTWISRGVRYGNLEQVGKTVSEEIDAAYYDKRLDLLVDKAFHYDPEKKEEKVFDENELQTYLISEDWKMRFAALEQIGAKPEKIDLFIKMAKDPTMLIRRLCIINLGIIKGDKVLQALLEALKDSSIPVRRTAGDALNDLGDTRAIGPMAELLNDPSKLIRWRAARFLFDYGDKSALQSLRESADDPEFEVRMQIGQAIERIQGGTKAQGSVWEQMIRRSKMQFGKLKGK